MGLDQDEHLLAGRSRSAQASRIGHGHGGRALLRTLASFQRRCVSRPTTILADAELARAGSPARNPVCAKRPCGTTARRRKTKKIGPALLLRGRFRRESSVARDAAASPRTSPRRRGHGGVSYRARASSVETPSINFKAMFPVKPSMPSTSATPQRRCRRPRRCRRIAAARRRAPSRAGCCPPCTTARCRARAPRRLRASRREGARRRARPCANAPPMKANWTRCSRARLRRSRPRRAASPRWVGTGSRQRQRRTMDAARALTMNRPAASAAPVPPAQTSASARPSPTALAACTIEASGVARTARTGSGLLATDTGASTSSMPRRRDGADLSDRTEQQHPHALRCCEPRHRPRPRTDPGRRHWRRRPRPGACACRARAARPPRKADPSARRLLVVVIVLWLCALWRHDLRPHTSRTQGTPGVACVDCGSVDTRSPWAPRSCGWRAAALCDCGIAFSLVPPSARTGYQGGSRESPRWD